MEGRSEFQKQDQEENIVKLEGKPEVSGAASLKVEIMSQTSAEPYKYFKILINLFTA